MIHVCFLILVCMVHPTWASPLDDTLRTIAMEAPFKKVFHQQLYVTDEHDEIYALNEKIQKVYDKLKKTNPSPPNAMGKIFGYLKGRNTKTAVYPFFSGTDSDGFPKFRGIVAPSSQAGWFFFPSTDDEMEDVDPVVYAYFDHDIFFVDGCDIPCEKKNRVTCLGNLSPKSVPWACRPTSDGIYDKPLPKKKRGTPKRRRPRTDQHS